LIATSKYASKVAIVTDKQITKNQQTISVFGLGYVGAVTAACLASRGNRVVGVDTNPTKVGMIEAGQSPIIEAGLYDLVARGRQSCNLHATTDAGAAIAESEISFICVGTPSQRNGKLDLSHIDQVCREIGEALRFKESFHLVVLRSTVLPGTTQSLVLPTLEAASGKRAGGGFAVCFNPEFMREGTGVTDFFRPPFTVLGATDLADLVPLKQLFDWVPGRIFETSLATAEMVKYTCNAFHALKVSFANEVGILCKELGADAQDMTEIFTSDTKLNISSAYLSPGFAFGGSCLPKDLRALTYRAKELDLRLPLMEAILPSNNEHIKRAVDAVLRTNKKKVGILGLSFKPGTDDLRESPIVQLIKQLLGDGLQISIWDKDVSHGRLIGSNRQFIEGVIPHIGSLLCANWEEVVRSAEVVLIGTGTLPKEKLSGHLRPGQIVIDLVNLEKARRLDHSTGYQGICW
jgi:GDP-mannose 6-dehydrogenase